MTKQIVKFVIVLFSLGILTGCSQQGKTGKKDSIKTTVKKDTVKSINSKSDDKIVTDNNKKQKTMLDKNIYIGMSIEEFKKICPETVKGEYKPTQSFMKSEVIAGIDGGWYFDFVDSKLQWYLWDIYITDINQDNFDKSLTAIKKIIEIYKKKYGEPTTYTEGKTKYIDPYKQRHWGYDVINAYWVTDKIKFANEFKFFGGKGEYSFILKIEFHDSSYKYF